MLKYNPKDRISFEELFKSEVFAEYIKDSDNALDFNKINAEEE